MPGFIECQITSPELLTLYVRCPASESIVKIYTGHIPTVLCIFTFCHIPRIRKLRTALVPAQHAIAQ